MTKIIPVSKDTLLVHGLEMKLLPQRALFLPSERTLVVADLHFGKAAHFRKSGVPVPTSVHKNDLLRLSALLQQFSPSTILFLGDMFHSTLNSEWEMFLNWRKENPSVVMLLAEGNHDILNRELYEEASIGLIKHKVYGDVEFHHLPPKVERYEGYYVFGHIHPCITLNGLGRQKLKLPCFYFAENEAILPAFGTFTGTFNVDPGNALAVYSIAGEGIVKLK